MTTPERQSILVIGATGATGIEILQQLIAHPSSPEVNVLCRDPSKLHSQMKKGCECVYQGDARSATDIERALAESKADTVMLAVGTGDSLAKSDIRTANAQVVASVMKKPAFRHVRAIVLSSIGAGPSRIKAGFGVGLALEVYIRHVLTDHTGQEAAFEGLENRTVIVRPTSLTNDKANGKIEEFGDRSKPSTIFIDRADVAMYMVRQAIDGTGGKTVNISGKK